MSSFNFPVDQNKYAEVSNVSVLMAMLKDDAHNDPSIGLNPFHLTMKRNYGYIKTIIAKCQYCKAKLVFKGIRSEIDHFNDDQRFISESSHSNPSY